jgi:hypothetical protein
MNPFKDMLNAFRRPLKGLEKALKQTLKKSFNTILNIV